MVLLKRFNQDIKEFKADRNGFPKFQVRGNGDSFRIPQIKPTDWNETNSRVRILKAGFVRFSQSRPVMSAFLVCYATDKGHDQALLRKWTTAEALLGGSGLCLQEPRNDQKDS